MQQNVSGNKSRISYSPQLDGLRAICILFTVFNHIEAHPTWINGSVGVDVFFVLSGFLITGILIGTAANRDNLYKFYIRRLFRIAPVYYLSFGLTVLAAFILAALTGNHEKIEQMSHAWPYILAVCGEYLPKSAGTFFGHAWTIGIEEKFYIIWPLIFLFLIKSNRWHLLFLAGLLPLFLIVGDNEFRGYGGIALGCIAAILYFKQGWRSLSAGLSACLLVCSYALILQGFHNIILAVAAMLFIPAIYGNPQAAISRLLAWPPLVWLGKLTFSVYMLHVLCLNLIKMLLGHYDNASWYNVFLLGYALTVLIAFLVYRFYEYPIIEIGRKIARNVGNQTNW